MSLKPGEGGGGGGIVNKTDLQVQESIIERHRERDKERYRDEERHSDRNEQRETDRVKH